MKQPLFSLLVLALLTAPGHAAEPGDSLLGGWKNADASTRWYHYVEFVERDEAVHVRLWGSRKERSEDNPDADVVVDVSIGELVVPGREPLVLRLDLGFKTETLTLRSADGAIICDATCSYSDPSRKGYTTSQKLVRER
jgi:hypothetical protein